jgi:predicted trehalose synthase
MAQGGDVQQGSLAFAQEFLPDVDDAWRVALAAAAVNTDFTAEAASSVRSPPRSIEISPACSPPRARTGSPARHQRGVAATTCHRGGGSSLAAHAAAIDRIYAAAEASSWPALQRVHGDYHLGQVLHSPTRGWMLLDFEGEPMRPIAERRAPDLALRDIAGCCARSTTSRDRCDCSARPSSTTARRGGRRLGPLGTYRLLDGYSDTGGATAQILLNALELDKAVYEAIYEARHRPAWLAIPLSAIERLLAD